MLLPDAIIVEYCSLVLVICKTVLSNLTLQITTLADCDFPEANIENENALPLVGKYHCTESVTT